MNNKQLVDEVFVVSVVIQVSVISRAEGRGLQHLPRT